MQEMRTCILENITDKLVSWLVGGEQLWNKASASAVGTTIFKTPLVFLRAKFVYHNPKPDPDSDLSRFACNSALNFFLSSMSCSLMTSAANRLPDLRYSVLVNDDEERELVRAC